MLLVGASFQSVAQSAISDADLNEVKLVEGDTVYLDEPELNEFVMVDQQPEFPGGQIALVDYMRKNISYPINEADQAKMGTVYVKFVVDKDGKIDNAVIDRGIGLDYDEEALRVVRSMPNWRPGLSKGEPVRVQLVLPIKFVREANGNSITPSEE